MSAAKPNSPDTETAADEENRSPRKCRHNHDYFPEWNAYATLRNSINNNCQQVKKDDYTQRPPFLKTMGIPEELAWPLKQTAADTDRRITKLYKANSQHYQSWLKKSSLALPAVGTLYRIAAALQDAKVGDLDAVTSLLRESVWHLDETRYGQEYQTKYPSDVPAGSLDSLCKQAEDALTRIEATKRQQGGVPTEIWDRREFQETPSKVNKPGEDWKFACSALLECAFGHREGSWETESDESVPVRRLSVAE